MTARAATTAAPAATATPTRYKLAMYWASACGGCDVAVLNLGMKLIEFTERWEPVFWPAAMDGKRSQVRAMADGEIDVCLFDGGIRTDEDAEMAHLLRAKSKVLVAFGSCAGEGCIPGLANQRSIESIYAAAYDPSLNDNPDGIHPGRQLDLAVGRTGAAPPGDAVANVGPGRQDRLLRAGLPARDRAHRGGPHDRHRCPGRPRAAAATGFRPGRRDLHGVR
jgi:hypothetical protein